MPNSETQYQRFLAKKDSGSPMHYEDLAARIDNEEEALLDYLIQNDFPQMWKLLHASNSPDSIGNGLGFTPDKKRLEGELKLLLVKRDYDTLNDIISNFKINLRTQNFTVDPSLIREMENLQTIVVGQDGLYKVNVHLS